MTGFGDGKFGDGNFGGTATATGLNVHVKSKGTNAVTLAWTAVPGADGYVFYRNGKRVSSTYDGTRTEATFSYAPGDTLKVQTIMFDAEGSVKV